MVRMKYDRLPNRSETKKQEGCRKRGRSQLRWEHCVKTDLRKAEEEEKCRENANNRDRWKELTNVAVQRSDNCLDQPHPHRKRNQRKNKNLQT